MFNEPVGNSFDEIVKDLVAPVSEGAKELCKVFIARALSFQTPYVRNRAALFLHLIFSKIVRNSSFSRYKVRSSGNRISLESKTLSPGWEITPRRHTIPDPIQVIAERLLKFTEGLLIHPAGAPVCLHSLVCFPYKLLLNFKRLCLGHPFLPFQVDEDFGRTTRLLGSKSITDPSTLLRVGPPLRCASVLWALRLFLLPAPLTSQRRFLQFRTRARTELAPSLCRTPPTQ